jgi:dolichol-phosphate mannosyltransferase
MSDVEPKPESADAPNDCLISVVVPTYHEAANVGELADRLFAALESAGLCGGAGGDAELILVDDDSRDGIDKVVAGHPRRDRIRLIVRTSERGLASAVLHGIGEARGRFIVVMDADLSHPPEAVPALLAPLQAGTADMAIGSRYVAGGSTDSEWSWFRRVNSRVATLLARPFARVTDPMSGFFAMPAAVIESAAMLNPTGYKIALELMVKCRCQRVAEVPIHFTDRRRGQSKLTFAEQLRYVEHLSRLYDFKFPHIVPVIKFLIVTFLGLLGGYLWIGLGCAFGHGAANRDWLLSAYWPAIAINLLAYWRYLKQMKGLVPIRRPGTEFTIISAFEWITYTAAMYWWLDRQVVVEGLGWVLFAWLWFLAAFVTRFVLRKLAGHDIRGLRPNRGLRTGRSRPTSASEANR